MTDLDTRRPEFTIAENGYDRTQVDAYVGHLQRLVADAEERARNAEAESVFDQHAAIGPRIAEIFALAEAEARELRERFSAEGAGLVNEARIKARAIIDAAEHAARELMERVEQDQQAMLAELEQDRERIHGEVNVLELRKGEALAELSRLSGLLGEATTPREASVPTQTLDPTPAPSTGTLRPPPAQPEIIGPTDESVDVEPADKKVDVEPADQKVNADPTDQKVDVDPTDETVEFPAIRASAPTDETVELPAVKPPATKRRRPPRKQPGTSSRTQPRTSPGTSD